MLALSSLIVLLGVAHPARALTSDEPGVGMTYSQNGKFTASTTMSGVLQIFRDEDSTITGKPLWQAPGLKFKDLYLSNDGQYVVLVPQGTILPRIDPKTPLLHIYKRGQRLYTLYAGQVIHDFSKLNRTNKGVVWGWTRNFQPNGQFMIQTHEGFTDRLFLINPTTGKITEQKDPYG